MNYDYTSLCIVFEGFKAFESLQNTALYQDL